MTRGSTASGGIAGMVARHFDEKRFGVDDTLRGQLRLNLVRAGYFRKDAINFYVFWRLAAVALLPLLAYLLVQLCSPDDVSIAIKFVIVHCGMGLGDHWSGCLRCLASSACSVQNIASFFQISSICWWFVSTPD